MDHVQLAIFDLDNTLLGGDSDYLWGQFLIECGAVSGELHAQKNQEFMQAYEAGQLDIDAYLAFALGPLAENDSETLAQWRQAFIERHIQPIVLPAAKALVEGHRAQGHGLMIITATNRFVTEPIAELFNIPILLATEPEIRAGRYTGRHTGTPTFREGKITALQEWLDAEGRLVEAIHFYSDSRNDLPLLRHVDHPVAVDPDPELKAEARANNWPIYTLRKSDFPERI